MYAPDIDSLTHSPAEFERAVYSISRSLVGRGLYDDAKGDLLALAERLTGAAYPDVDAAWNHFRASDRRLGSLVYNAAKLLPSIHRIADSSALLSGLRSPLE